MGWPSFFEDIEEARGHAIFLMRRAHAIAGGDNRAKLGEIDQEIRKLIALFDKILNNENLRITDRELIRLESENLNLRRKCDEQRLEYRSKHKELRNLKHASHLAARYLTENISLKGELSEAKSTIDALGKRIVQMKKEHKSLKEIMKSKQSAAP